jgi:cystathionine beta-lyase/cystathionine gamma-synthase
MIGPHGSELDAYAYAALALPDATPFAQRLAALEGGATGLLCRSREAALATLTLATARAGGAVLFQGDAAEPTRAWFARAGALGLSAEPVDAHEPVKVADALARGARALFAEQLSEHDLRELDVPALAWHARVYGASLCVDNTLLGVRHRRPLAQGADLVLIADLAGLCGLEDASEALIAVRSAELGEHVAAVGRALGALCPDEPARSRTLAVAASSYGLRNEQAQRSARALGERLTKIAAAPLRYPGVGRELGLDCSSEHEAAQCLARLPAELCAPCPSGVRTYVRRERATLRVTVGLERPDEPWDALVRALRP